MNVIQSYLNSQTYKNKFALIFIKKDINNLISEAIKNNDGNLDKLKYNINQIIAEYNKRPPWYSKLDSINIGRTLFEEDTQINPNPLARAYSRSTERNTVRLDQDNLYTTNSEPVFFVNRENNMPGLTEFATE